MFRRPEHRVLSLVPVRHLRGARGNLHALLVAVAAPAVKTGAKDRHQRDDVAGEPLRKFLRADFENVDSSAHSTANLRGGCQKFRVSWDTALTGSLIHDDYDEKPKRKNQPNGVDINQFPETRAGIDEAVASGLLTTWGGGRQEPFTHMVMKRFVAAWPLQGRCRPIWAVSLVLQKAATKRLEEVTGVRVAKAPSATVSCRKRQSIVDVGPVEIKRTRAIDRALSLPFCFPSTPVNFPDLMTRSSPRTLAACRPVTSAPSRKNSTALASVQST